MLSPQSQPSTICLAFLSRAACIGKWLSQTVLKPYVFLRRILLLAGDVETNPGPIQGRQRALHVSTAGYAVTIFRATRVLTDYYFCNQYVTVTLYV